MNKLGKYFGAIAIASGLYGCDSRDSSRRDEYDVTPTTRPALEDKKAIMFMIDTSGSMANALENKVKIESARDAVFAALDRLKEYNDKNGDLKVGISYIDSNDNIASLAPLKDFDYHALRIEAGKIISTNSSTPLGRGLVYCERELDSTGAISKSILMLTDGENSSGKEPDEVYKRIIETNEKEQDFKTNLNVVAFDVDKKRFRSLEDLGARVVQADSGKELLEEMIKSSEVLLEAE